MTEPADPTTLTCAEPGPPLPPFVCVLPCTKPAVSYGDRLDGCVDGIHVTPQETQDLQAHLYPRMADVILAKNAPLEEDIEDPCAVCMGPILPSSSTPVLYLERCVHYFHYYCVEEWRNETRGNSSDWVSCPKCRTESCRTMFWPQLFATTAAKKHVFQLQKRSFGLDVAPETVLHMNGSIYDKEPLKFHFELNGKHFSWCQGKPPLPAPGPQAAPPVEVAPPVNAPGPQAAPTEQVAPPVNAPAPEPATPGQVAPPVNGTDPATPPTGQVAAPVVAPQPYSRFRVYDELTLMQAIQELHLADRPRRFYLGDILPMTETPEYRALHGARRALSVLQRRDSMLLQYWCPRDRVNIRPGELCQLGPVCAFFHGWPNETPTNIKERVLVRHFPSFFCMDNTIFHVDCYCIERIRVYSQEVARCTFLIHPSAQDLKDVDAFACRMARQIMSPVVVPEPSQLFCSFCRKSAQPNSIWMHMENCEHCLHEDCLPLVRHNYRHLNRKLDVHCPACQVPSVRTIAWPGPFRSDMVKEEIFDRQLYEFKNNASSDLQVAVVQVANQPNTFTVDYGGPGVVTIDWASAPRSSTIWFD